jgi:hypothetical protein
VRTIDSVHAVEPWGREEELINSIGRRAEGAGPLTRYATCLQRFKARLRLLDLGLHLDVKFGDGVTQRRFLLVN